MTADRGYGEKKIDEDVEALGVKTVVIPRKGKPGKARRELEHSCGFRKLVKWRTGCEGRVAQLKHRYGWDRSMMDGLTGTETWCGLGVLAHNTAKVSGLIAARTAAAAAQPGDADQATTPTASAARARTSGRTRAPGSGADATGPPGSPPTLIPAA